MSTLPIRTALLGCGKVGDTHAEAVKSLSQSHLVAVCESNQAHMVHGVILPTDGGFLTT